MNHRSNVKRVVAGVLGLVFGISWALAGAAAPAVADEMPAAERAKLFEGGWRSYQRYCQSCHGEWGRGDGTVADWLKVPPADLTRLSEGNDGVFPEERVIRVIDGREDLGLHGRRDMPIWGEVLGTVAEKSGAEPEASGEDAEARVAHRIAELVEALRVIDRGLGPAAGGGS